jgi:hypothetical protein
VAIFCVVEKKMPRACDNSRRGKTEIATSKTATGMWQKTHFKIGIATIILRW